VFQRVGFFLASNFQRKDAAERNDVSRPQIKQVHELLRRRGRSPGAVSRGLGNRGILFPLKSAFRPIHGGFAMLVISRKNWESVVVGDPARAIEHALKVTVLEITKDRVRLGFEAADHIPVNRWEVWQKIHLDARDQDPEPGQAPLFAH
jgi:carbon storage regulator CsrA